MFRNVRATRQRDVMYDPEPLMKFTCFDLMYGGIWIGQVRIPTTPIFKVSYRRDILPAIKKKYPRLKMQGVEVFRGEWVAT